MHPRFRLYITRTLIVVYLQVTAVAFAPDGTHFVTAGQRHLKFWYLDSSKSKVCIIC